MGTVVSTLGRLGTGDNGSKEPEQRRRQQTAVSQGVLSQRTVRPG